MKKLIVSLAFAAAICMPLAAKQPHESATAVFSVDPAMSCANCENKIKTNLRFEKGVSAIVTSLPDQTVTVTYDPAKTNSEALVAAFKKIGYKASPATANAASACDPNKKHDCNHCKGNCK